MIAGWMVFSLLVGFALTAAALAAERLASAWHRPARFVWLSALVATACWPAIALVRGGSDPVATQGAESGSLVGQGVQRLNTFVVSAPGGELARYLDVALLIGWVIASGWLVVRLAVGLARLRQSRRTWRSHVVDGVPVHVSSDAGPAVIGFPMDVVLPEWALELDRPLRALVLTHEAEHRAARDPYLLLVATVLTVLFPWNVAMWWQARRLRLAVEVDCDARVLRAQPGPGRYACLLLAIAQRRSEGAHWLAPALLEPASNLERRISVMHTTPGPATGIRVLALTVVVAAAVAFACSVEPPDAPTAPASVSSPAHSADPGTGVFLEYQVEKPAAAVPGTVNPAYPSALRTAGVEGEVRLRFVVDTAGLVDASTFTVTRSTDEQFSAAARSAASRMRFYPAEIGGRKVSQVVELPITFRISR